METKKGAMKVAVTLASIWKIPIPFWTLSLTPLTTLLTLLRPLLMRSSVTGSVLLSSLILVEEHLQRLNGIKWVLTAQ